MSRLSDLESEDVLANLAEMLGVSRFLWEDFLRMQQENLFPVLADAEGLDARKSREQFRAELEAACAGAGSHEDAVRRLNEFKDREMFRTDLRHITQRIGFLDFSRELADLAEAVVGVASDLAHQRLAATHGAPRLEDGSPCGSAIAALGKFGGRELGFASDIELLFLYEGDGRTDGAEPIANAAYHDAWVRTVRDAIKARQEGIFEIDLRLRPYGAKGALATSVAAFARYYSDAGPAQQFERLALVRMRPIAGEESLTERVTTMRDTWVYSGAPIDIADILHLRERQATELVPSGQVSAKYSRGGVVDIEYLVQALQIEHGHANPSIRVPGTLEAAQRLADGGYVPELLAAKLQDAYGFLRRLIDALRVDRGHAKDLTIPPTDSKAFAYLARRLYFDSPERLAEAIDVRMRFGQSLWGAFERLRPQSE
jgi:glutamate-ammonia-ligase adenylyltransferase